jgi:hypothetical protein
MMKKNIGKKDRIGRAIIALILLIAAFMLKSWIIFFCALFVFFESFMSWCLFYQIIGKNTCPKSRKK